VKAFDKRVQPELQGAAAGCRLKMAAPAGPLTTTIVDAIGQFSPNPADQQVLPLDDIKEWVAKESGEAHATAALASFGTYYLQAQKAGTTFNTEQAPRLEL
jgi:hypothetical protein